MQGNTKTEAGRKSGSASQEAAMAKAPLPCMYHKAQAVGAGWQVLRSEAALESALSKACLQYLLLAEISSLANKA